MDNIHFDAPARMVDGRSYSNWQPAAVINERIIKKEHITNNWEYRAYLQHNAESVIAYDNDMACQQTGCPHTFIPRAPTIQSSSDLKNVYMSRLELQRKMYPTQQWKV